MRAPEPFEADLRPPVPGREFVTPERTRGAPDRLRESLERQGSRPRTRGEAATDVAVLRRRKGEIEHMMANEARSYWRDEGVQKEYRRLVTALDDHDKHRSRSPRPGLRFFG